MGAAGRRNRAGISGGVAGAEELAHRAHAADSDRRDEAAYCARRVGTHRTRVAADQVTERLTMSIGSILIGLLLFAATIPFVAKPLLGQKRLKPAIAGSAKVSNADQHQAALLALRDLEFDHRTGKVTDEDYAGLRADLLAQAAVTIDAKDKR